ncbi:MAG: DnaB-like helicase N-terminal domain-containing protein, partial [Micrococcales bacterium]
MSMAQAMNLTGTSSAERVLPNDQLAEQSVIGGMLLSQEACAEVFELIKGDDFYAPKHELIYDAVYNLYGRSEPIDVITVTAELTKLGTLVRVGGADYLHTLTSIVPTAANAGFYAKIVQEKATLRRLIEAGTRIASAGYAAEGDIDDLVNAAQADIYSVGSKALRDDYAALNMSLEEAVDEMELAEQSSGEITGVASGIYELDSMTHGLHGGQLVILAARPGVGKSTFALDIARNAAINHK